MSAELKEIKFNIVKLQHQIYILKIQLQKIYWKLYELFNHDHMMYTVNIEYSHLENANALIEMVQNEMHDKIFEYDTLIQIYEKITNIINDVNDVIDKTNTYIFEGQQTIDSTLTDHIHRKQFADYAIKIIEKSCDI